MLWTKVIHLLFVIAWMAGAFYLPRILVHYVEGHSNGEDTRRLVIMGQKLARFSSVMMVLAITPGLVLWLFYGYRGSWLVWKLGLVALLVMYQLQSLRYVQQMARGEVIRTSLFFRVYNEAALLLLIPILILVVIKPF